MALEDVIVETLRKALAYDKPGQWNTSAQTRGGGPSQGFGGGRNRGTPGYPLPTSLKGQIGSEPSEEGVQSNSVVEYDLMEADDPSKLQKTIPHLDDLKPQEFLEFLRKFQDTPIQIEISEKVDGSARISFGVSSAGIWTQSKNGKKVARAADYPDTPMYAAIKHAHLALESRAEDIAVTWPKGIEFMIAEVLYTRIPNSIEYGDNMIIVHGARPETAITAKRIRGFIRRTGLERMSDGKEGWRMEYKRTVPREQLAVDVRKEFDTLGEIYADLSKRPDDTNTLERFKKVQKQVKEKLVKVLRTQSSAYGPEGGDVEGLVFRELDTGKMTKLVDKDYFTQLNKFLWKYRELLNKGTTIDGKWQKGVMQNFLEAVASNVFGSAVAATPGFVKYIARNYPSKKGTPEQRADKALAMYVTGQDLMNSPDFFDKFGQMLTAAVAERRKLQQDWEQFKSQPHSVKIAGKERSYPDLVTQRTDAAFNEIDAQLRGIYAGYSVARGISDPLTQKVALLKLFMGHRFNKLVDELGGQQVQEGGPIDRMTGPTDLSGVPVKPDKPEALESMIREKIRRLLEGPQQNIGATIGRYQPFHAGHAAIIRQLAKQFSTVIVFIAGATRDKKNPFSYETRLKMMQLSLPDVWNKLVVLPASIQGKPTGFMPALLANAALSGEARVPQENAAITVLVGPDRVDSFRKQVENNAKHAGEPGYFNGTIDVVMLPGVQDDDNAGRISGTRVRQAIEADDRDAVRKLLDPQIGADSAEFEQVYQLLKKELPSDPLRKATEAIVKEMSAGAMATQPGGAHTGRYGGGSWSSFKPGTITGQEMFMQLSKSPNRMLPMDNSGTPDHHLPGQDSIDDLYDSSHQDTNKPTDLDD